MVETLKPEQAANAEQKSKATSVSGGWPFFDFSDAFQVPELINTRGGGVADLDQLAAWLNYKSTTSGTFASKLASARYFGLVSSTERGRVSISDRARTILAPVMPDDAVNAKAEAFLAVPLFKRLFDQFRGTALPPDVGLRNLFQHTYHIAPERVQQAVRVFKDSARQTGFFDSAPDRLIRPSAMASSVAQSGAQTSEAEARAPVSENRRFAGGGGNEGGIHPAILGMLHELPAPGDPWTPSDQKGFLDAFIAMVKFIYPAKGEADGA